MVFWPKACALNAIPGRFTSSKLPAELSWDVVAKHFSCASKDKVILPLLPALMQMLLFHKMCKLDFLLKYKAV